MLKRLYLNYLILLLLFNFSNYSFCMEGTPSSKKTEIAACSEEGQEPSAIKTLKQITLEKVSELVCFNPQYYSLVVNGTLPEELTNELLEYLHQKHFGLLNRCFQRCIMSHSVEPNISNITIDESGKYILISTCGKTEIWNIAEDRCAYSIQSFSNDPDKWESAVAFDETFKKLIIDTGFMGELIIWDIANETPVQLHIINHPNTLDSSAEKIIFDAHNQNICITEHYCNNVACWDIKKGKLLHVFDEATSKTGGASLFLQMNESDFSVPVLNQEGQEISKLIGNTSLVTAGKVNKNGQLALTGTKNGDIKLWNLSDCSCIAEFSLGGDSAGEAIDLLAFSDDNKYTLIVDHQEKIWRVPLFSKDIDWSQYISLKTLRDTLSGQIDGTCNILQVGQDTAFIRPTAPDEAFCINFHTKAAMYLETFFLFNYHGKNYAFGCMPAFGSQPGRQRKVVFINADTLATLADMFPHSDCVKRISGFCNDNQILMATSSKKEWRLWNLKHNLTLPEIVLVICLQHCKSKDEIVAYDDNTHKWLIYLLKTNPQSREKFLSYFSKQLFYYIERTLNPFHFVLRLKNL